MGTLEKGKESMGIYAGEKGCNVYRDGALTHVPAGELVPEFLKMSPQGLQSRIKQGIVTVNWDEDDQLLNGAPVLPELEERPNDAHPGEAVGGFLPVPLVATPPPVSLEIETPPEDWWPIETTRGFTAHLVNPNDEGKFLCGKKTQQPCDKVPEGELKKCRGCTRRASGERATQ